MPPGQEVPDNYFGITDAAALEETAGEYAAYRLYQLENSDPLTSFTRDDLVGVHSYLMQDTYPWAGQIRTTEVGAMGMPMCRAQYVDQEMDRVFRDIERKPASSTDVDAAVHTVADHWSEMTMVHPFQDGNSRTQRFFFDQMLRDSGWAVDWQQVNAEQVHAARYIGALTADPSYLGQVLRPGVHRADEVSPGTLSASEGTRDNRKAGEIFQDMRQFRATHPRGTPYEIPAALDAGTINDGGVDLVEMFDEAAKESLEKRRNPARSPTSSSSPVHSPPPEIDHGPEL